MRSAPVESFGRRAEPEQPGIALLPPIAIPAIQLPVKLVVDPTSLTKAAAAIEAMVAAAVRAGFADAISDVEADVAPPT
jgi:hypothetical protein